MSNFLPSPYGSPFMLRYLNAAKKDHRQLLIAGAFFLLVSNLFVLTTFADDENEVPTIPLAEVKNNVGKTGVVLMTVSSSNLLDTQKIAFLNSKADHRDNDNFTVVIKADCLKAFADKKVNNPADHFKGKKIRVTGKIVEYKDKPQIVVEDPLQITAVVEIELER